MTKLYIFIEKLIKIKRKLSSQIGYHRTNSVYLKAKTNRMRNILHNRSKRRLMERMQKKYQTLAFVPWQYEKWI